MDARFGDGRHQVIGNVNLLLMHQQAISCKIDRQSGYTLQKNILITGASRGLGAALAQKLASPENRLFLWARDEKALVDVRNKCEAKGADVVIQSIDLSKTDSITHEYFKVDKQTPIDIVYINAGLFDGAHEPGGMEELASEMALIDINVKAAIATAHAAATCMRPRKKGHIVFISSLAAHLPLADAAAYSASKAAITAYATALREKLMEDCITVTDVRPGHIETAMAANHIGKLPMIMSAEKAAGIIIKGVRHNKPVVDFPKSLALIINLSRFVPWRVLAFFTRSQRFHVKRSEQGTKS